MRGRGALEQEGRAACPTCARLLEPGEQVWAGHEAVCRACGTVLPDAQPPPDEPEPAPARPGLSAALVGNHGQLLPGEMRRSMSSLRRLYVQRPALSRFASICQWLELPPYVALEAWTLLGRLCSVRRCPLAEASLFCIVRSCQRHSVPRSEGQIARRVCAELGRRRIRSYARLCTELKPAVTEHGLEGGIDSLEYYVNLHLRALAARHPGLSPGRLRPLVRAELARHGFTGNNSARVRKAINFVMGGAYV